MPVSMELYLMRHGEAVSPSEWDRDDSSRPLTEKGKKQLEEALPYIQKAQFLPQIVLTSPFMRAHQTAEIICRALPEKKPVIHPLFASGAGIGTFKTAVSSNLNKSSILIIGHMPDLAHFASAVTTDPWLLDEARMDPAAIWALDPGPVSERWGEGKFIWKRNITDWKKN